MLSDIDTNPSVQTNVCPTSKIQLHFKEIPVEEDEEEESAAVDGDEAERDAVDIDMEEEESDSATRQGPSRASSNVHKSNKKSQDMKVFGVTASRIGKRYREMDF
eukprot:gene21034-23087_t